MMDGQIVQVDDIPTDKSVIYKAGKEITRERISPHRLAELLRPFDNCLDFDPFKMLCEIPTFRPIITKNRQTGIKETRQPGAIGIANLSECMGMLKMAAACYRIPFHGVTPSVWKRRIGAPADKGECRAMAQRIFPQWAASFARVKDEGRAEACLIAYYGWTVQTTAARLDDE